MPPRGRERVVAEHGSPGTRGSRGCIANDAVDLRAERRRASSPAVPTIQSLGFGALPAGAPGTVQPSIVSRRSRTRSSRRRWRRRCRRRRRPAAGRCRRSRSVSETSTVLPANARQVDAPLLVAVARAAGGMPGAGRRRSGSQRAVVVGRLVVGEERVQLERERADEAGVLARVAVQVGEGRPVVRPGRVRLDEEEVPVRLGVARDPEGHVRAAARDADRPLEPLVGRLARCEIANWLPGARRCDRARRGRGRSASQKRMPFRLYALRSNSPIVAVVRYEAIGSCRVPGPGRPAALRPLSSRARRWRPPRARRAR